MFESLKKKIDSAVSIITSAVLEKELTEGDLVNILWELQLALLENDVSSDVADKICNDIKYKLLGEKVKRTKIKEVIRNSLAESIKEILDNNIDFDYIVSRKKPFVILFMGINGTGKTTTIAKFAKYFMDRDKSVVFAGADTFRAAAIEQLTYHAEKLGVKIIKHSYGADAAAVCFDAIKHAEAKNIDIVLVDTAGRIQTNTNLMDELKKIVRVNSPDFRMFVGDALTGNDAVNQAKTFNDEIGIDGIVLTKIDADAKGGAALSISYITGKPILFLGIGQDYDDLRAFDSEWFVSKLLQ